MTDHIAGNPATFPASVALWEDSDPPDAAHLNLGVEDLADRTANLAARTQIIDFQTVSPGGIYEMRVTDGGTDVDIVQTLRKTPSDGTQIAYDISYAYTLSHVSAGGTATVKMMWKRDSGSGQVYVRFPVTLWAELIRPGS